MKRFKRYGFGSTQFGSQASIFISQMLFSGRRHPTKLLPASEEVFEPAVVTHDPINDPPSAARDLSRQQQNEMQETTEFHPE
jgi:hypothetical protein